jgi:transposase
MMMSEWLSVQAYAQKYGIATKTVRRRVKCPEKWGLEVKREVMSNKGSKKICIRNDRLGTSKNTENHTDIGTDVDTDVKKNRLVSFDRVDISKSDRVDISKSDRGDISKSDRGDISKSDRVDILKTGQGGKQKTEKDESERKIKIIESDKPVDFMGEHFKQFRKKGLPMTEIFDRLIHKKTVNKDPRAARVMTSYYKKQFEELGRKEIPSGLLTVDGRKSSGRKRKQLDPAIEKRFVEMVKRTSDLKSGADFLTRSQRRVVHYHKVLEHEFEQEIKIYHLYRVVKQRGLKKYIEKPDMEEDDLQNGNKHFFKSEPIYGLVQMDGSWIKTFKIKSSKTGKFKKALVIALYDTGSRYIFSMDLFWTESSYNSIALFTEFIKRPFPYQKVKFRPDNAGGFLNLERPLAELNHRFSEKDSFIFDFNPARSRSPKQKVHIERQFGAFRTFEGWIQEKIKDRYVKMEPGTAFVGNRKERRMIKCYDITIEELRAMNLIEEYVSEYNGKRHRFTHDGYQQTWIPEQRMNEFLESTETFTLPSELIDSFYIYGYKKAKGTVSKEGGITFRKREYRVVEGDFSRMKSTPVQISIMDDDRLILFEREKGGMAIGKAIPKEGPSLEMLKGAEKRSEKRAEKVEARKKATQNQSEYESILEEMKSNGMPFNEPQLHRLFKDGLTLSITAQLIEQNKQRYGRFLNTPKAFISFNLFITDFREYQKQPPVSLPLAVNQ